MGLLWTYRRAYSWICNNWKIGLIKIQEKQGEMIRILSEAIPQEKLVRAAVRDEISRNHIPNEGKKEYGFKDEDIIGWFATSHNPASGWLILKASDYDKREFGTEVFRS